VSKNPNLHYLSCIENGLTAIDVTENPNLFLFECSWNELTSLDISKNPLLNQLWASHNKLSSLDISLNPGLGMFTCHDNPGDETTFTVKAWFDNNSIPSGTAPPGSWYTECDFTRGSWEYDGKTITVDYILSGTLPPDPGYYASTDYSADGSVTQLQAATEGAGIDLVLMGDGYSDRLIDDGTYGRAMAFAMESFFTEEPYKSHREMFNVWSVTAVSKNELFAADSSTALSGRLDVETTLIEGNHQACVDYALKIIPEERMDRTSIIVILNDTSWHGTCYMFSSSVLNDYGDGLSISYFSAGRDGYQFRQLLNHEANGHGFAKLADEYWYDDSGTITDKASVEYAQMSMFGWWKNIDTTPDRRLVKWTRFLTDPRYSSQRLGVYEGGYVFARGVWRPSENSIMRYNTGGFNAPSREAVYYKIRRLAYGESWQYDYETFVAWDMTHYSASPYSSGTAGTAVKTPAGHTPPVIFTRHWREMLD
jgi:hypothetical protein